MKAPKVKSAAKEDKVLTKVKEGGVKKSTMKSKVPAEVVAKKVEKLKKKAPTPSESSESESSESSDSSEESEEEEEKAAPVKNGAAAADSSSESSDSDESESEDEKPVKNGAKVANDEKADSESESESESDEEDSEDSDDEEEVKKAPKETKAAVKKDEVSESEDSDDSEESESDEPAKAKKDDDEEDEEEEDSDDSDSSEEEEEKEAEKPQKKRKAEEEAEPVAKKAKVDVPEGASANLFVGNLSWNVDEEWLRSEFEEFGELAGTRIVTDRESGRSRGFGYVEFVNVEDAVKAHAAKKDVELDGRKMNLDYANARANGNANPRERADNRAKSFGDQTSPESDTLFIGNISFSADENMVQELFSKYGMIQGIRLPTDPESGRPKGFGYVQFSSVDEARAALRPSRVLTLWRSVRLDFSTPSS
ncbi:RNA binding protein, partial [Trichophyton rubrum CBS 118892]